MEVDVLIVMESGIPMETHVVKAEATAEATFEHLAKKHLGWSDEDFENEMEDSNGDYGDMLEIANEYLQGMGKEIIWQTRLSVNKFK